MRWDQGGSCCDAPWAGVSLLLEGIGAALLLAVVVFLTLAGRWAAGQRPVCGGEPIDMCSEPTRRGRFVAAPGDFRPEDDGACLL